MKIQKFALIIAFASLFINPIARANSPFEGGIIKAVSIHDFYGDVIIGYGVPQGGENCGDRMAVVIQKDSPHFTEMYAMALSASLTGAKVHGWVNGCSKLGFPNVTRLDLAL